MKNLRNRLGGIFNVGMLDFYCLILSYVIIAGIVSFGVTMYRNFDVLPSLDGAIGSFNRVVYLVRASGGNLSDALTPEQVVAKYQAVESDEVTLTIHSILTRPFRQAESVPL